MYVNSQYSSSSLSSSSSLIGDGSGNYDIGASRFSLLILLIDLVESQHIDVCTVITVVSVPDEKERVPTGYQKRERESKREPDIGFCNCENDRQTDR